jgi:hypothetical protein
MKLEDIVREATNQPLLWACRGGEHFWVNTVTSRWEGRLWGEHAPYYCLRCRIEKRD